MSTKKFARGVKLTIQHVYDPVTATATAMHGATLASRSRLAPVRFQWALNMLNSRMFATATNRLCLPFAIPAFQEDFNKTTLQQPPYRLSLNEISIAWDQRAEPQAITDNYSPFAEGFIAGADLTRLTMTIKLCEKTPTVFGGADTDRTEVLSLSIPGVEAFGSPDFRQNPLLVDSLNIPLNPFKVYWWEVLVPGLYQAPPANETLALPGFTLHCKCLSPLFQRDNSTASIQNLPTSHGGHKQTSVVPVITTPSADALIDGTTDLQATFRKVDDALLDKMRAGYGDTAAIGQEADAFPAEQVLEDSAYSVIIVPMWQGYQDLRGSEVALAGLPYVAGPGWLAPTCDRRLVMAPEGFVLHHAMAAWSLNAPPCVLVGGNATWGSYPQSATYHNQVGVALHNGLRGDNYRYQQVAYLDWTPGSAANYEIDTFQPYINDPTIPNFWKLLHVPLVSDNVGVSNKSYYLSGNPIFMGPGNNKTQARSTIGNMPAAFGGAAYGTPITDGTENVLEVRWAMEDAVAGLDFPASLGEDVLIGTGAHWVILVGKVSLHS